MYNVQRTVHSRRQSCRRTHKRIHTNPPPADIPEAVRRCCSCCCCARWYHHHHHLQRIVRMHCTSAWMEIIVVLIMFAYAQFRCLNGRRIFVVVASDSRLVVHLQFKSHPHTHTSLVMGTRTLQFPAMRYRTIRKSDAASVAAIGSKTNDMMNDEHVCRVCHRCPLHRRKPRRPLAN